MVEEEGIFLVWQLVLITAKSLYKKKMQQDWHTVYTHLLHLHYTISDPNSNFADKSILK